MEQHDDGASSRGSCALSVGDVLTILASDIRREILVSLARGAKDVRELTIDLNRETAHVSGNLRVLRNARFVTYDRDSKRHVYELGAGVLARNDKSHIQHVIHTRDDCALTLLLNNSDEPGRANGG